MAVGDLATWVATIIAFCTGVAGFILGLLGYLQARRVNALAAKSAARGEESWFVDWRVTWDQERDVLVVNNTGSNAALGVTITVAGEGIHEMPDGWAEVRPNQTIDIPLPVIATQREKHIEAERHVARSSTGFNSPLKVTVGWKTGLGSPDSRTFDIWAT